MLFYVKPKVPEGPVSIKPLENHLKNRGFKIDGKYQCVDYTFEFRGNSPSCFLLLLNDKNELRLEESSQWIVQEEAEEKESEPSTT